MPTIAICKCVKLHSPSAIVVEQHHILPLSWGGLDTADNKIALCAQTHFTVHFILNEFVRQGDRVPKQPRWPRYAYGVALDAWDRRIPNHRTPYWLPPPLEHNHP